VVTSRRILISARQLDDENVEDGKFGNTPVYKGC
jgi:hypothetical protein